VYAARVAARIRRELKTDVEMVRDRYGIFQVKVDGNTVVDGGAGAFLGILPSGAKIVTAVREALARAAQEGSPGR